MRDVIAIPMLLVALGIGIWWLAIRDRPATDAFTRVRTTGVLRIGYANEAPFAWRDSATGEVTGEAPGVAKAIAVRLGMPRVEGVLCEFGSLIPGLRAGRFDMIAAGMYITPERAAQVLFSRPTCRIGCGMVVAAGGSSDLHAYEDVRDRQGARLGVVAGAIEQRIARELGVPADRTVVFNDTAAAIEGLAAGRVEAFACTALTARDLAQRSAGRCVVAEPFREPLIGGRSVAGYGAFAFRREDLALHDAVERELAVFVGSTEHQALVAPFGFAPALIPTGVDAEMVIAGDAP